MRPLQRDREIVLCTGYRMDRRCFEAITLFSRSHSDANVAFLMSDWLESCPCPWSSISLVLMIDEEGDLRPVIEALDRGIRVLVPAGIQVRSAVERLCLRYDSADQAFAGLVTVLGKKSWQSFNESATVSV